MSNRRSFFKRCAAWGLGVIGLPAVAKGHLILVDDPGYQTLKQGLEN